METIDVLVFPNHLIFCDCNNNYMCLTDFSWYLDTTWLKLILGKHSFSWQGSTCISLLSYKVTIMQNFILFWQVQITERRNIWLWRVNIDVTNGYFVLSPRLNEIRICTYKCISSFCSLTRHNCGKVFSMENYEMRDWLFNVTCNDISGIYVTAHRCAGELKKKLNLRSGP